MTSTSVRVALRVRPLNSKETLQNCSECITFIPDAQQVLIGTDRSFTFDHVFSSEAVQVEVFDESCSQMVDKFIEGFNTTILAYGQTGSGKTHSMGTALDSSNIPPEDLGIVPRAINKLFSELGERKAKNPAFEYQVSVSFLELYNEDLVDLLNPHSREQNKKGKSELTIREDSNGQIYWAGVKEVPVASPDELLGQLAQGSLCRTVASTDMNLVSSRSHAIFSVILQQSKLDDPEEADKENIPQAAEQAPPKRKNKNKPLTAKITSKFHFVDLAGSERLKRTNAVGDRAKEGIAINGGLLALGNVISALGDESRKVTHVPYRDSKLTRLLQDSLGGNSQTLMLACVSPADSNFMETLNTLKYANRARNIKNKVSVNESYGGSSVEVNQLRAKINRLQMEITALRAGGVDEGAKREYEIRIEELQGKLGMEKMRSATLEQQLSHVTSERDTILFERHMNEQDANAGGQGDQVDREARIQANPIIQRYIKQITDLKSQVFDLQSQSTSAGLLNPRKSSFAGNNPNREKGHITFCEEDVRRARQMTDDDTSSNSTEGKRKGKKSKKGKRSKKSKSSGSNSRADSHFPIAGEEQETAQPLQQPLHGIIKPANLDDAKNLFAQYGDQSAEGEEQDDDAPEDGDAQGPEGVDDDNTFKVKRRLRRRSARDTLERAKEQIKQGLLFLKNGGSMHDDPVLSQLIKTPSSTKSESYIDQYMQSHHLKNENRRSSSVSFSEIQTIEIPAFEEPAQKDPPQPRRASNSSRSVSFSDQQISPSSTKSSQNSTGGSSQQNAITLTRMLHQIQADIAVKEQLVSQLERAEQEFTNMRGQYEHKLALMQEHLIQMQRERDVATKRASAAGTGISTRDKSSILTELKARYEHKMKKLIAEIGDLRRKYNEATQSKQSTRNQSEATLKNMKSQLVKLKGEKLAMVKRLKSEAEKIRQIQERNGRELENLRRKEKSSQQERKKLKHANEVQKLMLDKRNREVLQTSSKLKTVMSLLKRTSTPKSIAKAFRGKRNNKVSPDGKDQSSGKRNSDDLSAIQDEVYASGNEKKKMLDQAISAYITGQQSAKLIDELLKKREKLNDDKNKCLEERENIISANVDANGNVDISHEALAQDLDDRIEMMNSEITYINARIRALQAEAARNAAAENNPEIAQENQPGAIISQRRRSSEESNGKDPKKKRRKSSSDSKKLSFSLPPNATPETAYDCAVNIMRNLDPFEQAAIVESFFEDVVHLRTSEWSQQMTLAYQEKTIAELQKTLLTMRRAAVLTTVAYERKNKQLEDELRYGGRTPSPVTPTGLELEISEIENDCHTTISLFDRIYENSVQSAELNAASTTLGTPDPVSTPTAGDGYSRGSGGKRSSYFGGTTEGEGAYALSPTTYSPNSPHAINPHARASFSRPPLPAEWTLNLPQKEKEIGERRGSGDNGDRRSSCDSGNERRGSGDRRVDRRGSGDNFERRGSGDNFERRGSSDRGVERRGSSDRGVERRGSSDQGVERRGSSDRGVERRGSGDMGIERKTSIEQRSNYDLTSSPLSSSPRESLQREVLRRTNSDLSDRTSRSGKRNSDEHVMWADGNSSGQYQQPQEDPSPPQQEFSGDNYHNTTNSPRTPPESRSIQQKRSPDSVPKELILPQRRGSIARDPDSPREKLIQQRRNSIRDSLSSHSRNNSTSLGFYSNASSPGGNDEQNPRDSGYFSDAKRRSASSMARRGSKDLSHLRQNSWGPNGRSSPESDNESVTSNPRGHYHVRSPTPTSGDVFKRLSEGPTQSSSAKSRHKAERRGSIQRGGGGGGGVMEALAALEGRAIPQDVL